MGIRKPIPNKGSRIPTPQPIDYDSRPPLFSLEKLIHGPYCLSALDQEAKAQFAESIFKRKSATWRELKTTHRHGLGIEKISKDAIKVAIPNFITPDVDHFLAFRFHGKKPMVGYRDLDIFYVLWFDHNFTLYAH